MTSGVPREEYRCTANSKQRGARCKRASTPGSEVCKFHGGKSAHAGVNHPTYQSGRYSNHLPKQIVENYEKALADPKALELRDEVAVIQVHVEEKLSQTYSGGTGLMFKELKSMWGEFEKLSRSKEEVDRRRSGEILNEMGKKIRQGDSEHRSWDEVGKWIDRMERIKKSERQRAVENKQMLTADEMLTLVHALTESVRRHVTDRDALQGINDDVGRLMHLREFNGREAKQPVNLN